MSCAVPCTPYCWASGSSTEPDADDRVDVASIRARRSVDVAVKADALEIEFSVRDDGPGVSSSDL